MVIVRIGDEQHTLEWNDWEDWVRRGRIPPDALVRAEAVTGEEFVRADSLESFHAIRDERAIAWRKNFVAGTPPILTALLVGIQVRIWWYLWTSDESSKVTVRVFTNWTSPALEDGQTYRLITMGLLHTEFLHMLFNMAFLAYTGWNLERALGRMNLFVLYFSAVIGGSVLSMFGSPATMSLGASGGVYGLVSACVVFGLTRPELLPERGRRLLVALLPYLVVMFISGLMSVGTDNWSHLGGLIVGGGLAMVLDPGGLQRSKFWNTVIHVVSGLVCVGLLLGLALAGPRLHPLADSEDVRRVYAEHQGQTLPVSNHDPTWGWRVPMGWRPKRNALDDPGFGSPVGPRHFSARQTARATPTTINEVATRWTNRLQRTNAVDVISAAHPAIVAGWPGQCIRAEVASPHRVLKWCGAVRGTYVFQTIWQVEAEQEHHLATLGDKLAANVEWGDPTELVDARLTYEHVPASLPARAALADAQAKTGDAESALQNWRALLETRPDSEEYWQGLLQVARWYPDKIEDHRGVWADALAARTVPTQVVAIATSMDAAGETSLAAGLLDIAWLRWPGERSLKRARRTRSLDTWLHETEALPWTVTFDPVAWHRRTPVHTLPHLTIEQAVLAAKSRDQRTQELDRQATEWLKADDSRALRPLTALKYGYLPDPSEAVEGLAEDARTVALGGRPSWMPSGVFELGGDQLVETIDKMSADAPTVLKP